MNAVQPGGAGLAPVFGNGFGRSYFSMPTRA